MTTRALLRTAGLLAWVFAGIPAIVGVARDPGCMPAWGHPMWLGAFAVFGVAFWKVSAAPDSAKHTMLVAVQTAAALVMLLFICTGFESALLVVAAVQLGLLLPLRVGLPWLLGQSAAMAVLVNQHMRWPGGGYFAVCVAAAMAFAFVVAAIAGREARSRRELAAANEEIARLSRDAERVRIARELHDVLGHDLVALHLNLEAARAHAPAAAQEPLQAAQAISKALLDDVRKAVGALRDGDVGQQLAELGKSVQQPKVHLAISTPLEGVGGESATALVRCVQEIVTNSAKHASASNLWVEVARQNGAVRVTARDDGRGAPSVTPGNGLNGMRERISALGGQVTFDGSRGFEVQATIPVTK